MGTNQYSKWQVIDVRTNEEFLDASERTFTVENPENYRLYHIVVDEIWNSRTIKITEFGLSYDEE